MKEVIQSQQSWNKFQTSGRVGIVTTLFTEQFLENSYELIQLSNENFAEEIELNGIDTVFIDNDLFEADHGWYRKNRGHLINYLKNKKKNICVIKNTSVEVAQIFKRAFILHINPHIDDYVYEDLNLESPLLINEKNFNPVDSDIKRDIIYLNIGKTNNTLSKRTYNMGKSLNVEVFSNMKVTRGLLEEFIAAIKNTKLVYINSTSMIDEMTLKYIEYISYLNSAYVMYDHKFELSNDQFIIDDFATLNNKISMYLKNPDYLFRQILIKQRQVLLENTFVKKQTLKDFIKVKEHETIIPRVSIITSTNRKDNLAGYFGRILNQKNVELEINLVTHGFQLSDEEKSFYRDEQPFPINFIEADSDETLGVCLNKAIDASTLPVIAKIDDDDYYMENYILDQWIALKYSNADMVGKSECYYYFKSNNVIAKRNVGDYYKFNDFVMGATIMSDSETMKKLKFDNIPRAVDTNFIRRLLESEGTIYVGHPFELCVFRSNDTEGHTWQVGDLAMLKNAEIVGYGDPATYVTLEQAE